MLILGLPLNAVLAYTIYVNSPYRIIYRVLKRVVQITTFRSGMLDTLSGNCQYCAPGDFFKVILCVCIFCLFVCFELCVLKFPTDNGLMASDRVNEQAH
jgi:hypothetical protein